MWRERLWYAGAFAALAAAMFVVGTQSLRLDMVAHHAVAMVVAAGSAACALAALAGLRSWVGWVNFFALQWFGLRLYRWRQVAVGRDLIPDRFGPWRYAWTWATPLTRWWSTRRCLIERSWQ